jgi:hypothetical protein
MLRSRAVAHAVIGERNEEDQRFIIMIKRKLAIDFPRENEGVIVNNYPEIFSLLGSAQYVACVPSIGIQQIANRSWTVCCAVSISFIYSDTLRHNSPDDMGKEFPCVSSTRNRSARSYLPTKNYIGLN